MARERRVGKLNRSDSGQPDNAKASQPSRFTTASLRELLELFRRFDVIDSSAPPPADRRPASDRVQD